MNWLKLLRDKMQRKLERATETNTNPVEIGAGDLRQIVAALDELLKIRAEKEGQDDG